MAPVELRDADADAGRLHEAGHVNLLERRRRVGQVHEAQREQPAVVRRCHRTNDQRSTFSPEEKSQLHKYSSLSLPLFLSLSLPTPSLPFVPFSFPPLFFSLSLPFLSVSFPHCPFFSLFPSFLSPQEAQLSPRDRAMRHVN